MFWMETLMVVGLVLAMAVVLALMVGPLSDTAEFPQDEDPFEWRVGAHSLHNLAPAMR